MNTALPRIYTAQKLVPNQEIILDSQAARHLVQVLRLKANDNFVIFNGEGGEFVAKITEISKAQTKIFIEFFFEKHIESPLKIELWQGISRGEKMDFTIQKAVELGVFSITPIFTEYCNVKIDEERLKAKIKHWQNIAISASEQSGRCCVPRILTPQNFNNAVKSSAAKIKIILSPENKNPLKTVLAKSIYEDNYKFNDKNITLLVGPEGGFSNQELLAAEQNNFITAHLGPRILRTETAGLAAISILQSLHGDLK